MFIFLIFVLILITLIYLPINVAISYYYLRNAESDLVWGSLMTSRSVNMTASALMIFLSVLAYVSMAFAFEGSCSEHRGPSSEACAAFPMLVAGLLVLVGLFFLFILTGLWFSGRKPAKIDPPSILK